MFKAGEEALGACARLCGTARVAVRELKEAADRAGPRDRWSAQPPLQVAEQQGPLVLLLLILRGPSGPERQPSAHAGGQENRIKG